MDSGDQLEVASALLQLRENAIWHTNWEGELDVVPTSPRSDFESKTHNRCSIFASGVDCNDHKIFTNRAILPAANAIWNQIESDFEIQLMSKSAKRSEFFPKV